MLVHRHSLDMQISVAVSDSDTRLIGPNLSLVDEATTLPITQGRKTPHHKPLATLVDIRAFALRKCFILDNDCRLRLTKSAGLRPVAIDTPPNPSVF